MARVITISGGKGGVGKTNLSVNLALALSDRGSKVCLFDADLGLANVNILLGLYPDYDLEDVILNNKSIDDILIKNYNGIDIIPGSSGVERLANLERADIERVIESFSELEEYDYFIFDTSSGISKSVISFCLAASEVVMVITTEPTSLTDAYALLKVLCFNHYKGVAKIVVNQCKNTTVASRTYNKLKEVVHKYLAIDIAPLGIVVQDKKLAESVHKQKPLVKMFPDTNASRCIQVIAQRLMENEPEDFKPLPITSFWKTFLDIARNPIKFPDKNETPETREQPLPDLEQSNKPKPASAKQQETKDLVVTDTEGERTAGAPGAATDATVSQPLLGTLRPPVLEPMSDMAGGGVFERMELSNLPSLPSILLKLIATCSDEDASMKDLALIVEKDPSLCMKILRMVNSVYYSFSQKVQNFNQALALLGIDTIRSIAVSASVYQVFDGVKDDVQFNLKYFWWHSLTTAVLANLIAKKISYPMPEEAFLSGMLHDIGKLVLLKNYPEEYAELLQKKPSSAKIIHEEQQQLEVTHCETGAWLIRHWNLQSFIADAILYHHEPAHRIVNALPLVKIIYVANGLCSETAGSKDDRFAMAFEILDLEPEDIEKLLLEAEAQVDQIAESLDIDIEHPEEGDTEDDREAQAYLTSQIRDISLLQGTLQSFLHARDVCSILRVAQEGLQLLFDIRHTLFFLYDDQHDMLCGKTADKPAKGDLLDELKIPCKDGKSLIVTSLQQSRTIDSFSHRTQHDLTIIDEQIIRLLGREGIICLPMIARSQFVGALVIGMDKERLPYITSQIRLMTMFANHAALALDAELARQSQARRVLEERLAAATAIARKVAHEVNNPLSIIKNYLKILELNLTEQDIPSDEVSIIHDEINRVASIVDELSDFSKPKAETPAPVDINTLVADLAKLTTESFMQRDIHLHLDLDASLPPVVTGKNGLKQVCLNLVKNAGEALNGGGNIYIETKNREDAGEAEIVVRDDGPGLSDVIKERLFEPYASTKGESHAGLGLAVVYSIVKELQGTITCDSTPGAGTTFTLLLPIA